MVLPRLNRRVSLVGIRGGNELGEQTSEEQYVKAPLKAPWSSLTLLAPHWTVNSFMLMYPLHIRPHHLAQSRYSPSICEEKQIGSLVNYFSGLQEEFMMP